MTTLPASTPCDGTAVAPTPVRATGVTVLVMGAGSIGGWLGGRLQAAGATVHFVGRPRMLTALAEQGLRLTDLDGGTLQLPAAELLLHPAVPEGLAPDLVLLCVKSGATVEAATELGRQLPAGTLVVSMQNGIGNAAEAQLAAPRLYVLPGMVPFNLETAVGRVRVGRDAVRWQGATTLRAHARETEPGLKQS